MKPFFAIVAHVDIMIGNVFNIVIPSQRKLIVATHVSWLSITLLLSTSVYATTIVAITDKNYNRIIIAADSMATVNGVKIATESIQLCKLVVMSGCVFGIAGAILNPSQSYDLQAMASNACAFSGDLQEKADFFEHTSEEPIRKYLSFVKVNDRQYFGEVTGQRMDFAGAIFAGMQDRQVNVFERAFIAHADGSLETDNKDTLAGTVGVNSLGVNDRIHGYLTTHPQWYKDALGENGMEELARKFISFGIKDRPDIVGPPISILEIDHSVLLADPNAITIRWIEPGACQ